MWFFNLYFILSFNDRHQKFSIRNLVDHFVSVCVRLSFSLSFESATSCVHALQCVCVDWQLIQKYSINDNQTHTHTHSHNRIAISFRFVFFLSCNFEDNKSNVELWSGKSQWKICVPLRRVCLLISCARTYTYTLTCVWARFQHGFVLVIFHYNSFMCVCMCVCVYDNLIVSNNKLSIIYWPANVV